MRTLLSFVTIAFLLMGCEALGIQAESPREKLVVLEYSYQGVLKVAKQMAANGALKGQSAEKATELIKQARAALKTARSTVKSGGSVNQSITLVNSLVTQLIVYIESKKDKVSWATYSSPSNLYLRYSRQLAQQLNPYNESRRLSMWRRAKVETSVMMNLHQSPRKQIYFSSKPSIS